MAEHPQMWQHPFVNVFKSVRIGQDNEDNKRLKKHGEVSYVLDEAVRFWALRLKGHVSANNYCSIPATSTESLDLHGRFMYVQLRAEPPKVFVLHISVNTTKRSVVRFSFSSMHKQTKVKGNSVEIPLLLTQKWTVLGLDLPHLLAQFAADGYDETTFLSVKSVQMCSTMNVRNIFTSDTIYRPDDLPIDMGLKLPKDVAWSSRYRWLWLPGPPAPSSGASPSKGPLREKATNKSTMSAGPASATKRSPDMNGQKRHYATDSILREDSSKTPVSTANKALQRAADLLEREGKSQARIVPKLKLASPKPPTLDEMAETLQNDLAKDREKTLEFAKNTMSKAGIDISSINNTTGNYDGNLESRENAFQSMVVTSRRYPTPVFSLRPDPIMDLEAVIGYRGTYANTVIWSTDGKVCIFPSNTCIVMMSNDAPDEEPGTVPQVTRGNRVEQSKAGPASTRPTQHLLFGHTEEINTLALSRGGGLIASAQEGKFPMIRLWAVQQSPTDGRPLGARCAAILSAHASGLTGLTFSPDDQMLCAVGKDAHHRVQVIVWNVARAYTGRGGAEAGAAPYPIVAKQISEFDVKRIKFSPYEEGHLVSCGRENIRFWRIKSGLLRGCPVRLNEYARGTVFTDLAFESAYGPSPSEGDAQKRVFVSTAAGTVVQVNYASKAMECVYRLHDSAIHTIAVNEGFCVTGSEDKFLRVWPLDFSDYVLEAEHEGPVQSVDVSPDGLKLVVGTSSGTLGVLDVSSHAYHTLLRSHVSTVYGCAIDPHPSRNEFGTVSADGTIRIWSLTTLVQLCEFLSPEETSRCIAYQPVGDAEVDVHRVACGFDSGCVRIFDIPTAKMPHEYQQHRGPVVQVLFDPSRGHRLYSAGVDGHVCVYDVTRGYQPVKMIASDSPAQHVAMAISFDGALLAALGPDPSCAIVFSADTLMPLRKFRRKSKKRENNETKELGMISGSQDTETSSFKVLCFNKDATELIVATSDRRLARYDVATGTLIRETTAVHRGDVNTLDLSPSGAYLMTAGNDRMIRVWDAELRGPSPPPFQSFVGHASSIMQLAFSKLKDGVVNVVSVGEGNGVFVWRFYGVEELLAEQKEAEAIAAAANAEKILSSSADDTYRQHRTKRLAASPRHGDEAFEKADPAYQNIPDESSRDPEDVELNFEGMYSSPEANTRLFRSALAQIISTVQNRGQMISTFITKLGSVFSDIDTINDGTISTAELAETLRILRIGAGNAQITAIIWSMDPEDSGRVDHANFIAEIRSVAEIQARNKSEFAALVADASVMLAEAIQSGRGRDAPLQGSRSPVGETGTAGSPQTKSTSLASVAHAMGVEEASSGLQLTGILGYTGGGLIESNRNVLWHPDSGLFGFSTGQAIVLENLKSEPLHSAHATNKQTILTGPESEMAMTALSQDGRYIAAAENVLGGTESGTLFLWDAHGKLLHRITHDQGKIQILAFDASNRCLISIGTHLCTKVVVWDVSSGMLLCEHTLAPGSATIDSISILPAINGGVKFLSCGRRTISEWTMVDSPSYALTVFSAIELPGTTSTFPEYLTAIDCRPSAHHENQKLIVAGGSGGTVWLFRAHVLDDEAGAMLKFKLEGKFSALDGGIEHLQWRTNVSAIVVAGVSNKVKLIGLGMDATSSPKTLCTTLVDGSVKSMTWEGNLKDGIIGTDAGSIWYLSNNHGVTHSSTLARSHTSNIQEVSISSDGTLVASAGGADGILRIWHEELMQDVLTLEVPPGNGHCNTTSFPITGGTRIVAAGYENGTVRQFNLDSITAAGKGSLDPKKSDSTPCSVIACHQSSVTACAYVMREGSGEGDEKLVLVTGDSAGEICIQRGGISAKDRIKLVSPHSGHSIRSIHSSPFDPAMFLASSDNGCISVWKVTEEDGCEQVSCGSVDVTSEEEAELAALGEAKPTAPMMACFSPSDSDLIMCTGGSDPCVIVFWQFATGQIIRSIDLPVNQWPMSLCSSETSNGSAFIAVGTRSGALIYMDYHSGTKLKCKDSIHGDIVRSLAFSSSHGQLLAASENNLHFWEPV
jgi:WD40 repeat protein